MNGSLSPDSKILIQYIQMGTQVSGYLVDPQVGFGTTL